MIEHIGVAALPQWIVEICTRDVPPIFRPSTEGPASGPFVDEDTTRDLRSALMSMRADDRVLWVRIGHALKELGDQGRALWMEWSSQSTKFDARESAVAWDSFRPTQIGYQSVFFLAQQHGWLNSNRKHVMQVVEASKGWAVPTPLPTLPPVQPFNADLLPVVLRPWVMDISHRMQCPPDFPAVAALVGLSSLVAAHAVVQPKARDDWQVVPNLWGGLIGRPGVKKTPAQNEALKPLREQQTKDTKLWEAAMAAWESECKAAARAKLEPPDPSTKPIERRYIVNDATVEKLGELFQQNPQGLLYSRDELYGFLTSLDKQGQESSRTFCLTSSEGNQAYTFDRIGRGTIRIPRVCLSIIGGIQPGRIQEYVRGAVSGGTGDDGLLQRFGLMVWPDIASKCEHVDEYPNIPARQIAWAVFERLSKAEPESGVALEVWRFTPKAQALFVEWLVALETEIRGEDLHPAMASHLAKYRKVIPALALIFAMIDTPGGGSVIGETELLRALAWYVYLRSHAARLYSAATAPETAGAASLLKKIKTGVLGTMFTPRQIATKGWTGLDSAELAQKAANILADFDWLRFDKQTSSDPKGRGRPSERYFVNPAAWNEARRT